MGGPSGSDGRRWARRSCRTGGRGGVVRRTVAAPVPPASGAITAQRRTEGYAHVHKQRRVHGLLSDFRCCTGSTAEEDNLPFDVGELKHKSSHKSAIRCLSDEQRNVTETNCFKSPIAESNRCDVENRILVDSERTSVSWQRENKISSNYESRLVSSTASGLPTRTKYNLNGPSNNWKNPLTVKSCSDMKDFRYQLVKRAERSSSMKTVSASSDYSLSEKMALARLRQSWNDSNHLNRNRISALNRRHRIVKRMINPLSQENNHDLPNSSLGRYSQALLDNALLRQNKLCFSEQLNQNTPEQPWSSTYDEFEKNACFSSSDSVNDLQVSSSSDTSDNSNLSSLGSEANDQWKMTFKKVYCPHAARLDKTSGLNRKEIGQASPVSVLEPPSEDCFDSENIKREPSDSDPYDLKLEPVKFLPPEAAAELSCIGETCEVSSEVTESSKDESIQLVEDIFEDFEDEEEREFSYLLDILIASGIHGTAEEQLYKVCHSLDCPAGYEVFEKLEKKYFKVVQWSKSERKLLFDMVNTILSQILAPCLNMQPWIGNARNLAPLWGSEGLLERVLQVLAQTREELSVSQHNPEKKALDPKWPDLADCIDRAGRDIERMIKDDLLEELLLELLAGSYG